MTIAQARRFGDKNMPDDLKRAGLLATKDGITGIKTKTDSVRSA